MIGKRQWEGFRSVVEKTGIAFIWVYNQHKRKSLWPCLQRKPSDEVPGLDNYSPPSNLPFMGKAIEKVVPVQLWVPLTVLGLSHSGFWSMCGTGTESVSLFR